MAEAQQWPWADGAIDNRLFVKARVSMAIAMDAKTESFAIRLARLPG
jgi:hypothetical protein